MVWPSSMVNMKEGACTSRFTASYVFKASALFFYIQYHDNERSVREAAVNVVRHVYNVLGCIITSVNR